MFDMAYELGAELGIKNKLNLTPLTLAAKLARKEIFFHILNIEREIYWQIGSVTCAAYPLTQFDTIHPITGGIQKESALNLIVFGESTMHLDLLEGPVMDLLHAKWNTFVKFRFYRQFFTFLIYFIISINAFISRPIHKAPSSVAGKSVNTTFNSTLLFSNQSNAEAVNATLLLNQQGINLTTLLAMASEPVIYEVNDTVSSTNSSVDTFSAMLADWNNGSDADANNLILNDFSLNMTSPMNATNETTGSHKWFSWSECLEQPTTTVEWVRLSSEGLLLLGAISFILGALRECQFLGASMFFENLVQPRYENYCYHIKLTLCSNQNVKTS